MGQFVNYSHLYIKGYMQRDIKDKMKNDKHTISLCLFSSHEDDNYTSDDDKPIMIDKSTSTFETVATSEEEAENVINGFLDAINHTASKLTPREEELLHALYECDDPLVIRERMGTSKQCIFNWRNRIKFKARRFFKNNPQAFENITEIVKLKEKNNANK